MNLLAVLENGLFALGQVLRFPVMTLLWVCVAAVCFMAGSCFTSFLARRKERQHFNIKTWLRQGSVLKATEEHIHLLPSPLESFTLLVRNNHHNGELEKGGIEHIVMEVEESLKQSLNPSRMLVKVAPSLGLLGTLIPMGVSLAAMSAGNLEAMAGQMVVAFTTTIVGLACGTGAYVVNLVQQSWINETIREQRFIAERIYNEISA